MEKQLKTSRKLIPQIAVLLIKKGALVDMEETRITIKNSDALGLGYDTISLHSQNGNLLAWDYSQDKKYFDIFSKNDLVNFKK